MIELSTAVETGLFFRHKKKYSIQFEILKNMLTNHVHGIKIYLLA